MENRGGFRSLSTSRKYNRRHKAYACIAYRPGHYINRAGDKDRDPSGPDFYKDDFIGTPSGMPSHVRCAVHGMIDRMLIDITYGWQLHQWIHFYETVSDERTQISMAQFG